MNDAFLTAVAEAAHRYHADQGVDLGTLNASFVVSTRRDDAVGGNAFSPTRAKLPASEMPIEARFTLVHDLIAAEREHVGTGDAIAGVAAVASRLPTAVISRAGRQQTASIDVATSNFRAAPFTVYIGGAKLMETYPIGPLAGTASNITAMSYDGTFFLGVFSDPVAIPDPEHWRNALVDAFDAVLTAAGVRSARPGAHGS